MAASTYRRVPGRSTGLLRRDTLWLGPDHLLRVHSLRFSEEYRRFYLADIQAIVVQKRPRGAKLLRDIVMTSVSAALTAAAALTGHPVWATLAGVLFLACALYAWRQADCRTWLQTAVGVEELPSLCRERAIRKALPLLDETIRAAQPALAAEQIAQAIEAPPPLTVGATVPAPPPLPVAEAAAGPSRLYLAGYVTLLALGAVKVIATLAPSVFLYRAMPVGYFAVVALLMIPLFRGGLEPIRGARSWAVITSMSIAGTLGATSLRWVVMRSVVTMQNQDVERLYSAIDRSMPLQLSLAVMLLGLAIWGLAVFGFTADEARPSARRPLTLFGADRP